jgi:tRNA-specific 2-thiouridylase
MSGKKKVVVAMSGGVDSSVAAGILVEQGYDVVGLTIKTFRYEDVGGNAGNENTCCSLDGINDARAVAAHLGFPHFILDFSEPFGREVIDNFVGEYLRGRTPNPCVVCNRKIKWEELLKKATALGAREIATGHYARVRHDVDTGRYWVARGRDDSKDQSYALWGLTQESLSRTLFPLAGMTKPEARALAARYGLPVAGKGESYEICFIPDNDYERFLKERLPDLEARVAGGEIVRNGEVVGKHRGFPFYTVGQRKGVGIATGDPVYVTGIDPGNNRILIGPGEELMKKAMIVRDVNLLKYAACDAPRRVDVKIRYKDGGGRATMSPLADGRIRVDFELPRRAITPGQSAVFYEGDDVVGGGVIDDVLDDVPGEEIEGKEKA